MLPGVFRFRKPSAQAGEVVTVALFQAGNWWTMPVSPMGGGGGGGWIFGCCGFLWGVLVFHAF